MPYNDIHLYEFIYNETIGSIIKILWTFEMLYGYTLILNEIYKIYVLDTQWSKVKKMWQKYNMYINAMMIFN